MSPPPGPAGPIRPLTRRRFLALGGAATLLAACGNGGSSSPEGATVTGPQLVGLFSPNRVIAAGLQQRIPFAVVNVGDIDVADTAELPVKILRDDHVIDELTVAGRLVEHDHLEDTPEDHSHSDLLRYYALRATLPEPGIYDIEVDFGDPGVARLPVQGFDPAEVSVIKPGDALPPLDTPTFDRPEGIDPFCTRTPEPCPFHDVSVADALDEGRPMALLVATPALCQTAYCGPVVETLMAAAGDFPDVACIHLEFYANGAVAGGNYDHPDLMLAPQVTELGLDFEPSLILADAAGTVVDRIDNLFDEVELRAALQAL